MTRKWARSIIHKVVKTILVQSAWELPLREHLFFAWNEKKTPAALMHPHDSNMQWPSVTSPSCAAARTDRSRFFVALSSSFLFSFLLEAHFPIRKHSTQDTLFLPSFPSLHPLSCSEDLQVRWGKGSTLHLSNKTALPWTFLTKISAGRQRRFPAVSSCYDDQQHVALISISTKGFTQINILALHYKELLSRTVIRNWCCPEHLPSQLKG